MLSVKNGSKFLKIFQKSFSFRIGNFNATYKIVKNLIAHRSRNVNPDIFCYETTNKPIQNHYRVLIPRKMKDNSVLILKSIDVYKDFFERDLKKMNNIFIFFSFFFIISLYNLNSLLLVSSFISGSLTMKYFLDKSLCYDVIIESIYLKSCGKKLIVNTKINEFEVDIINVRKMRITEYYMYEKLYKNYFESCLPLVMDYKVYLVPKSLEYIDKEIMFSVSNSCYILND